MRRRIEDITHERNCILANSEHILHAVQIDAFIYKSASPSETVTTSHRQCPLDTGFVHGVNPGRTEYQTAKAIIKSGQSIVAERRFFSQKVVILLCESMRFISHILQQSQRIRMLAQHLGIGLSRKKDFLFAFRQ